MNQVRLQVALLQLELAWEDQTANIDQINDQLREMTTAELDIVILPEMFTTGFSMRPERFAETMDGRTVGWMRDTAKKLDLAICGSVIINENDTYRNRFIWAAPDGQIQHYDKVHLFAMAGEDQAYTAGSERIILEYNGWRICPLICYDLRFPEISRNHRSDIDLLIYVANWPETRVLHWRKLLQARAIENQCYVIGVNRVGQDDNGLSYTGDSMVVNALGNIIVSNTEKQCILTEKLPFDHLSNIRKKLPFLADQRY